MVIVKDYRDEMKTGYFFQETPSGYRWVWGEDGYVAPDGKPGYYGDPQATLVDALLDAAEDWDFNKNDGSRGAVMRRVAGNMLGRIAREGNNG